MISHDRAQRLLSARLDELLPPAEHRALQEHLAACPECRSFAHQAEALAHDLHGLPFLPPSPAVSRAVLAEIRRGDAGFSPLAWLGGLRFSSGPALAVVSSFVLIAAVAFTVSLALKPPADADQTATTAAVALAQQTPTPHSIAAPPDATLPPTQPPAPTTAAIAIATTRPVQLAPTATRAISIQAPPTPTPTIAAANDAPPVEPPAIVVATDVPPAPTDAPQLAQGDTTQSMDLAQSAHKGGKSGQKTEAQAAGANQPLSGAVDAALAPPATDASAGNGGVADANSGSGTYDAVQPTIAPTDATPPPDESAQPTIAPSSDQQTGGQQLDAPQSQPGQGGADATATAPAADAGPPTPTPFPTFPPLPTGFGDTKMQVSLTAGQNGKPASISVAPVPPTPTAVPTATATPDPASLTPTPAADGGTPADPAS